MQAVLFFEGLCCNPEDRGFESKCDHCFNLPNPSSRAMALRFIRPLTEVSN
jgi:hypothetical protein